MSARAPWGDCAKESAFLRIVANLADLTLAGFEKIWLMAYAIFRVGPDGGRFELTTLGRTSDRERALARAQSLNSRLKAAEPDCEDRFIVQDEKGRELKSA
jgi:hypothetical protein